MSDRLIPAASLAELLGRWRERPRTSAYRALGAAIELLVLDGRIPIGARLPAERDLARLLAVSRTTVAAAYALLRERGFVHSRRGSGSRTTLPNLDSAPSHSLLPSTDASVLDLACAAPSAPPGLAAAVTAATQAMPAYFTGHGYEPHGIAPLRETLAAGYTARGLPTTADQILVTAGAQHAFALVLRAFAEPGDRVLVEQPTYPNALEAIRRSHARPVPVPMTATGWDAAALTATIRQTAPRLAYLIADFQNPTGALMDDETRAVVARALGRARTLTVADETLVDLPLDLDALPRPFASHDGREQTITIGSTSKSMWGGLRVGWLRTPRDLLPGLLAARASLDLGSPALNQLIADHLINAGPGLFDRQRATLRARRAALVAAVGAQLPSWRFRLPPGGLSLWCELAEPVSTALAAAAGRHGVRLAPGPRFGADGALERFVRLPYTLPETELVDAVGRIAAAYAYTTDSAAPTTSRADLATVVA